MRRMVVFFVGTICIIDTIYPQHVEAGPTVAQASAQASAPDTSASGTAGRRSPLQQAVDRAKSGRKSSDRVVGGSPASLAINPWQVALVSAGGSDNTIDQYCGASIIGTKWLITAAHCIDARLGPTAMAILFGTDDLRLPGRRISVAKYVVHPDFREIPVGSTVVYDNDLALIQLFADEQAFRGRIVQGPPNFMPDLMIGTPIRVTGWGMTDNPYQRTATLQGVELPYVSNKACNAARSYNGIVSKSMLCSGPDLPKANFCYGDSGGPATADINGHRRLVGIVSWILDCQTPYQYSVFTRLSKYVEWVRTQTMGEVSW